MGRLPGCALHCLPPPAIFCAFLEGEPLQALKEPPHHHQVCTA